MMKLKNIVGIKKSREFNGAEFFGGWQKKFCAQ